MARIHILEAVGLNAYRVVIHTTTPVGNNAAGIPWSTAIANSGRNINSMVIGNGPGQITNGEANQISAGTVFEASGVVGDDPNMTPTERAAYLENEATKLVNEQAALLQAALKYFGTTRA